VLLINTNLGQVALDWGGHDGWQIFDSGSTESSLDLPLGAWHQVLLAADGSAISAEVDGTWAIAVSDDRFKTGQVGVEVGPDTNVQFDDFVGWNIPEGAP
jgi:hypothetical protein